MGDDTTVVIRKETRDKLRSIGQKGESYDEIINALIFQHISTVEERLQKDREVTELRNKLQYIEEKQKASADQQITIINDLKKDLNELREELNKRLKIILESEK